MVDVRGDVLRPPHSLESDVRFTYWPKCMECQVSSLESVVIFTYWPP